MSKIGVILAAGEGARLDHPNSPKPLVKVGNKSLIVWNIEQMQQAGVETIYVVLGHRGEEIQKELVGHPDVTATIEYIHQTDSSKEGMLSLGKPGHLSGFKRHSSRHSSSVWQPFSEEAVFIGCFWRRVYFLAKAAHFF